MRHILPLLLFISYASLAQDDCNTALPVTDLTGVNCTQASPSTTNFLAAGNCEEGNLDTWFSFVAQGPTATITVTARLSNWGPEFLVVSSTTNNCANYILEACEDLGGGGPNGGNYNTISNTITGLVAGQTYWVVVSSHTDQTGGTIDVCIENPPAANPCLTNQDCSTPTTISLNAPGSGQACITDCNTGATPGPDFNGNNCYDLINETVWFSITTDANTVSLDIDLSSTDLTSPEFTLFQTTDCLNFTIFDCVEGTGGSATSAAIAVTPNTTYIIAVSDVNALTGNFQLCINQNAAPSGSCILNQDCSSPTPISLNPSGGSQVCVSDCNTQASPGPIFAGNNCYNLPNETVWFSVTTDASASSLQIDLTSSDLTAPEITVFTGNSCGGPYTIVDCIEGTSGAANILANVAGNTTYLIAISDVGGATGNFNICASQLPNLNACNTDNTLVATSTSLGSSLTGPFQPGEVVTFCYTINSYMTSTTNCNYLQGIVPEFGDCWDPVSFDANGMPTITTPLATVGVQSYSGGPPPPCNGDPAGTWSWYPAGSVDYNLNQANPMGLSAGDDVGAGWFFVTNYNSYEVENFGTLDCTNSFLDPDDNYGDNSFPACADLGGWQVCFQLQAKDFIQCTNGFTDCSVSIKTFADGEIGVWQNIGCVADQPTLMPASLICVLLSDDFESFYGRSNEDHNALRWEMSTLENTNMFSVERSADGTNWEMISNVSVDPNTLSYQFNDYAKTSMDYYRIKSIGDNNEIKVSNTINLRSSLSTQSGLISNIYPNPAQDNFVFEYTGQSIGKNILVSVINALGETVISRDVSIHSTNQKIRINTEDLSQGVYYVQVLHNGLKDIQLVSIQK